MPSAQYVFSAIYGAWRLALLDPRGLEHFDITVDGFWRSFFAAVVVAPFYLIMLYFRFGDFEADGVALGAFGLVKIVSYGLGWAIFPVVMVFVARLLSLSTRYIPYIIAYNWSAVIQVGAFLPVALLDRGGVLSEGLAALLIMVVTVALLFYHWFIARVTLQTTAMTACGLVILDLVLGILIDVAGDGLLLSG